MSTTRVVVIGADAAGMSAAHQALRTARSHGRDLQVIALERSPYTSYSACGIPYWVAGDVPDGGQLSARTPQQHRDLGVEMLMGATATALDLGARKLTYRGADQIEETLPFDEVVLATGAAPIVPPWARSATGELIAGVHPVKDLGDGQRWIEVLSGSSSGQRPHAVVVGGGYIGIEMAEALLRRGWDCTMVTREVMVSLDPDMRERVQASLEAGGLRVLAGATIEGLETDEGRVRAVALADGTIQPSTAVVLALGVRPTTEIGRDAGLAVGASGGYLPDATGRVADGAWAAGDCCETFHRLSRRSVFLPLGTHANKQGKVVGTCLGGGSARFAGVLGTAITRFVAGETHVEIARTGLGVAEAEAAGFHPVSMVTEGRTASGYMPEASRMATKVIADADTRLLLGMQILGGPGAGKRIDTAAASLWGGLSVDEVAWMDLAYAPPFATVWEAVQLASRRLADRL